MFTKKYIEMVTQADEIQKLWKQKVGDWVVDYNYMTPTLLDKKIEGINKPITVIGWLPTLEDLFGVATRYCQEDKIVRIVIKNNEYSLKWGDSINRYLLQTLYQFSFNREGILVTHDLKSLLLTFIMKFAYHKSWNSDKKEWEESNGS